MKNKTLYLDSLPRKNGRIKWEDSIGYTLPFIYGDIEGSIKIIGYDNKSGYLTIKYNDNIKKIKYYHLKNCKIGKIIGVISNDFKFQIGQNIKDINRDLTIIEREFRKDKDNTNRKYYKYHCNKCGNEEWVYEGNLILNKRKCGACTNPPKNIVLGINTIWDTDRWMCDLGVSEEDAKKYTSQSNKRIEVECPDCGKKRSVIIANIYKNKTIFCACGDKRKYPEKVMISVLDKIGVEYIKEYSPEWIGNKRYDFYIKDLNMIIETHGEQHYSKATGFKSLGGRTLKEEQSNDKYKRETALANGIKYYIELDCSESNMNYIKNSILNSELNKLFDLSKVNWLECAEFANKNIVKEACEYWNKKREDETTSDVGTVFGLSRETIINYLKKGTKLDWCNYNPKEKCRKCRKIVVKKENKKWVFDSVKQLIDISKKTFNVEFKRTGVVNSCLHEDKLYKGFKFSYLKEGEI